MNKKLPVYALIALILFVNFSSQVGPARASDLQQQASSVSAPAVLCMPGIYNSLPGDCLPAGPSAYLTRMASQGITLPISPIPGRVPSADLARVNVYYGEVRTQNAPIYGSLEDAIAGNKKNAVGHLSGQTVYISYTEDYQVDGKRLYNIGPGQWMKAADIIRIGALPSFQGLEFSQTPVNDFGWVLTYWISEPLQTKRTPGTAVDDYTGHVLNLYDAVQIFAEQDVDGELWYLVGPDEWVSRKFIARVSVYPTPPDGVDNNRWIEVNLQEQTIAVYQERQLVFATIIASGSDPFWTRPGLFQVYDKLETTPMRGALSADMSEAYYLEDVPWTMYFDEARALHGAYWRAKMGFPQSHGCVNMTVGDAHWLFDWAELGDWVYVWDPSGQTPTDPSLYGSGGF